LIEEACQLGSSDDLMFENIKLYCGSHALFITPRFSTWTIFYSCPFLWKSMPFFNYMKI